MHNSGDMRLNYPQCLVCFPQMQMQSTLCDLHNVFNSIASDWNLILHAQISERQTDPHVFNCGREKGTHQVFDCMTEWDNSWWNLIVSGYERHGFRKAFTMFSRLLIRSIRPTHFNKISDSDCIVDRLGRFNKKALTFIVKMRIKPELDARMFLLRVCRSRKNVSAFLYLCWSGRLGWCSESTTLMENRGIKEGPDVVGLKLMLKNCFIVSIADSWQCHSGC